MVIHDHMITAASLLTIFVEIFITLLIYAVYKKYATHMTLGLRILYRTCIILSIILWFIPWFSDITNNDYIYFETTANVNDTSAITYTIEYDDVIIETNNTKYLYIDLNQNIIVAAKQDGTIVAPEKFAEQNITDNPNLERVTKDIVLESEEQYLALEAS